MPSKDSFRDSIATMDFQSGKRKWLYPKLPKGKLTAYRHIVGGFLLALFFILPFVRVQGDPFILLNIFDREFILFGVIFWPQDTYLFVIAMISLVIFCGAFYRDLWQSPNCKPSEGRRQDIKRRQWNGGYTWAGSAPRFP